MTTLTIMRILPREVDPMVYKMSLEDPGGASFAGIGGLGEQVRELPGKPVLEFVDSGCGCSWTVPCQSRAGCLRV